MNKYLWFMIIFLTYFLLSSSQLQAQSLQKQSPKRKQLTVKHDAHGRPHVEGIVRKFKTPDTSSLNKNTNNKESNIDVEMERFNKDDYEVSDPQALDAAMQRVDDSGYPMMENAYSRMAEKETADISIKKISEKNFISKPALNQQGIK